MSFRILNLLWTLLLLTRNGPTETLRAAEPERLPASALSTCDLGVPTTGELLALSDGRRILALAADRAELRVVTVTVGGAEPAVRVALPFVPASVAETGGRLFVAAADRAELAVLELRTLKTVDRVALPAARLRRVLSARAGGTRGLVVLAEAGPEQDSATVAFVLDPACPAASLAATPGLRLTESAARLDAAVTADGRWLYLWRVDAPRAGIELIDLVDGLRLRRELGLPAPLIPDPTGMSVVAADGSVVTADLGQSLGSVGEGVYAWHPTRPMLLVAATDRDAVLTESTEAAAGATPRVLARRLVAFASSDLRRLAEWTLPASIGIGAPLVNASTEGLAWLTLRPRPTDDGPALGVVTTVGLRLGERSGAADPAPRARPDARAVVGREYLCDLAPLISGGEARLRFAKLTGPGGLTVTPEGRVSFVPSLSDLGRQSVQIEATDPGSGRTTRLSWGLQVRLAEWAISEPGDAVDSARPPVLRLSPDGRQLAVLNRVRGELTLRRPADGAILGRARPSAAPADVTWLGERLLLADADGSALVLMKPGTPGVERRIALPTGHVPMMLSVLPGTTERVLVLARMAGADRSVPDWALLSVTLEDGTVVELARPSVDGSPGGTLLSSPDGQQAYWATVGATTLTVLPTEPASTAGASTRGGLLRTDSAFRRLSVGPVDGRLYAGRVVLDAGAGVRLGLVPGELTAPHPTKAVALSLKTEAGPTVTRIGFDSQTRRRPTEPVVFRSLREPTVAETVATETTLIDAAGFAELARWSLPLPGPAEEIHFADGGATALLRCGDRVVLLPLPTAHTEMPRYFAVTGSPSTRLRVGRPWQFAPGVWELVPGERAEWSVPLAPPGLRVDAATGVASWTPTVQQVGPHRVILEVRAGTRTARRELTLRVEPDRIALPHQDYTAAVLSEDGRTLLLWRRGGTRLTVVSVEAPVGAPPIVADPPVLAPMGAAPAERHELELGVAIERVFLAAGLAWVIAEDSDTLLVLATDKLPDPAARVDTVTLPAHPVQVTVRPGSREVFVSDATGSIRQIDADTRVERGVVAWGTAFAFDPSGSLLMSVCPTDRLGFDLPEGEVVVGAATVLIVGGRDNEPPVGPVRKAGTVGGPLRISTPGSGGETNGRPVSGSLAWLTWLLAPEERPKPPLAPGAAALRAGTPAVPQPPRIGAAAVFGGPNSPWRLLDAVRAADAPDRLSVSPDGATLAYLYEGRIRRRPTGDLSAAEPLLSLPPCAGARAGEADSAVAVLGGGVGSIWVVGRSGRLYRLASQTGRAPVSEYRPEEVAALPAIPMATPRELSREVRLDGRGVGTAPNDLLGCALAVSPDGRSALFCRGKQALRLEVPAVAGEAATRPLRPTVAPPADYSAGELVRWSPRPDGVAPIRVTVLAGPEGMNWDERAGQLLWDAPAAGGPNPARAVILFAEKTGRQGRCAFVIMRADPEPSPTR